VAGPGEPLTWQAHAARADSDYLGRLGLGRLARVLIKAMCSYMQRPFSQLVMHALDSLST